MNFESLLIGCLGRMKTRSPVQGGGGRLLTVTGVSCTSYPLLCQRTNTSGDGFSVEHQALRNVEELLPFSPS